MVKNPPAMWETWVRSLGWEDPLEEGMATHSSILAWRIPWIEEPGGLQSMESTEWLSTAQHQLFKGPEGIFLNLLISPSSSRYLQLSQMRFVVAFYCARHLSNRKWCTHGFNSAQADTEKEKYSPVDLKEILVYMYHCDKCIHREVAPPRCLVTWSISVWAM